MKNVILVVSFGTSHNETRAKTIEAIEKAIGETYPDYEIRRAFTSPTIIGKLAKRDGLIVDNVTEALERLIADGVKKVFIQPTYVITGFEYDSMIEAVKPFENKFASIGYGLPLLTSDADYNNVVKILADESKVYANNETAVVYMGHGSKHRANNTYMKLDRLFKAQGYSNYFIGTVEDEPTIEDIISKLETLEIKRIILYPLMIVAGEHAVNDMSGDSGGSWKNILESKGYEVECVLKGLGEYRGIQALFAARIGKVK